MKKQITIFIIAMFLMSIIPVAFAQEDTSAISADTGAEKDIAFVQQDTTINTDTSINAGRATRLANIKDKITNIKNIGMQQATISGQQIEKVEPRLKVCVDFLRKNNLAENPVLKCSKLLKKEIQCVAFLKEKGVDNPLAKCDMLFRAGGKIIRDRSFLAKKITQSISEAKLKKIDRLVEKYPKATDFVKNLPEQKAKVFLYLPRAEQRKLLEMDSAKAIKNIGKFKLEPVKKTMLFKKRIIALNNLKQAENKFKLAKQKYVKVNKVYREKKALFLDVKARLKACEGVESNECTELREQAKEHAKEFLINGANMAIEHLNKIKHKIESAEDMDVDKAQEIIADIDNAISKLDDAIAQVEAAQTKEEIQEAAKVINNVWKSIKHKERLHAARLVHAKVWNIIKRSEHLEERLDAALAKIEEQGIDVGDIDAKLDEFSAKIAEAKEKFENAKELLEEADDLKTESPSEEEKTAIKELVSEARQLLREAHNDIKEAHQILMDVIQSIRSAGGEITPEEESAEEGLASDEEYEVVEVEE